jgi:hypothetical protein
MSSSAAASPRTAEGRFTPGASGNPKGRPKGSRNFSSIIEEALREGEAAALIRLAVAAALGGDRPLLRFFVNRIWPAGRGRLVGLGLAEGAERDPASVLAAAIRAVADGTLSTEEAATLGRLVRLGEGLAGRQEPVSDLYPEAGRSRTATAPAAPERRRSRGAAAGGAVPPAAAVAAAELPAWLAPKPPATRSALFSSCSPAALAA